MIFKSLIPIPLPPGAREKRKKKKKVLDFFIYVFSVLNMHPKPKCLDLGREMHSCLRGGKENGGEIFLV